MAAVALLPCPFCGSAKQTVKHSARWGWFVSCECAAVGPSAANRKQAVGKWNCRMNDHAYGNAPQMTLLDAVLPYE